MNTEERINSLESRVRRQRFGMAFMGLGMVALLALGMNQQAPKKMILEERRNREMLGIAGFGERTTWHGPMYQVH